MDVLHLQAHDQLVVVHGHPKGGGEEVGGGVYLSVEERSDGCNIMSAVYSESLTHCQGDKRGVFSTPFCKLKSSLLDETTSYFRLNLPVWWFTCNYNYNN